MRHSRIALLATSALISLLASCARQQELREPHNEAELSGLTIACTNGNYYHNKFAARPDVSLYVANAEADGIQAVRQGLADVYVGDDIMFTAADQQRLGIKTAFLGDEVFDVAFAMQKGNAVLKAQLDKFLQNNPIEEIVAHWRDGAQEVPEPDYTLIPGAKPLVCICSANISPISFIGEGGVWKGLEPDILRRFAHSLGREVEFSFHHIGSGIMAVQGGKADILAGSIFATEARKKVVDFSAPYHKCRPGYFVLDREAGTKHTLGDRLKASLVTEGRWKLILGGLAETLKITFFAILLGTLLGFGICACKRSGRKFWRSFAKVYGSIIAGIPTLVILLIMFYVVFANVDIDASLVAIITFALCFASSSGNIFDTGISSVPHGQTEAGLSLGFTPFRTFTGIVVPQAMKKVVPLYTGECVGLLKNTSIVGYIAIQDLTRASDIIRSRTFDALVPLLAVTVLYFVFAWLLRKLLSLLVPKK